MTERIRQMVEYLHTHNIYPPTSKVDFDPRDMFLPDPIMDGKRVAEYMAAQPVKIDEHMRLVGLLRFDGSVKGDIFRRSGHRRFGEISYFYPPEHMQEDLALFESQHATADFSYVIANGLEGCLRRVENAMRIHRDNRDKLDFLEGIRLTIHGIVAWANHCADACEEKAAQSTPERAAELRLTAETLRHVPLHPARTFREAVQCLFLCFHFLPDSLGTMDRYLYPTFRQDMDAGVLTYDEAKELLQELFIMVDGNTPFNSGNADKGGESHFAVGGYTVAGEDGFNDLSRLIIEAMMDVPLSRPQVSLRWTKKTPREVLRFMMDCERNDKNKRIAFANDEPRIRSFMKNLHLSWEQAVNYTMVGCNEPALQGSIYLGGCTCNGGMILENIFHKAPEKALACKTFEEFYALFEAEAETVFQRMVYYSDGYNRGRSKDINLVSSIFINGSIEQGVSVSQGGCDAAVAGINVMGVISIIDSLTVIKKYVYDEGRFTMAEMLRMLAANWEGYEDERRYLYRHAPFFGNNEEISDEMARRVNETFHRVMEPKRNIFGFRFLLGTMAGYRPHYAWCGEKIHATPDTRHDFDAFMVGSGQTGGKDRCGMTAMLNSVAQMDPTGIIAGPFVCNLSLEEKTIREDDSFERIVDVVEAYFENGGQQIQLNYVSKEELEEALAHPEEHGNLRVRVSGFSAYYTKLNPHIQKDILNRTVSTR